MLDTNDILDTIRMISDENLDVRTVTMGISLLDCADADGRRACEKIYNKITSRAKNLVRTAERISATYGMPIVNKRVSVTPIAMLLASAPDADPVWYARALDAAAKEALSELGMADEVEHVTDFAKIAAYGVMSTPALVVDGKVVSYGKALTKDEARAVIAKARGVE